MSKKKKTQKLNPCFTPDFQKARKTSTSDDDESISY